MTNGAECIIKKVDYRVPGSLRPSISWALFQEEHIGKDYRKEYSHLYNQTIDRHLACVQAHGWEGIEGLQGRPGVL